MSQFFNGAPYSWTGQVKGGLYETGGVATLSSIGHGAARRRLAMWLGRSATVALRKIMATLDGVVPGSLAQQQWPYVFNGVLGFADPTAIGGGQRLIGQVNLVNRATSAADATTINADLLSYSTRTYTTNPVPNLDRNPLGTR